MIQYLLFVTSKLLNISDITKRIGNFFKLPIQLSWGIAYPELALLELIAHELEHCYQFDIGEYSMSYREDGVMYRPDPNDREIGHLSHGLYDLTDEKKAYGIQSLFDGTGLSKELYKGSLYSDLPDDNFNSKNMIRSGIEYSPKIYTNKLQQASNVMGIVFRHDGIKYEPQELKSKEKVNK